MNQTLEEIGKALFRQWFVDFEFPNEEGKPYKSSGGEMVDSELGEIPKGWKITNLNKIVNITYGKGLRTNKLINTGFPVYGGNGRIGYYSKYLYEEPQIIIGCRGAASGNIKTTVPKSFITNNSLVLEIPEKPIINRYYLENYLHHIDIKTFITGSAQPQITISNIKFMKVLLPDEETMQKHKRHLAIFDKYLYLNELQVANLEQIRDSLLPRLISGKLRIN
jgi:type I restriction enzyme S subunit